MPDKYSAYFSSVSKFLDILLLNAAGLAGYLAVLSWSADKIQIGLLQALLVNFLWFNVTQLTRLYLNIFAKDAIPTTKAALGSLLLFALLLSIFIEIAADFHFYHTAVILPFTLFSILFLCAKIGFLLWRRNSRYKFIDYKSVVILGGGRVGMELKDYLEQHPILGYHVHGFFDDLVPQADDAVPALGTLNDWLNYARKNRINEVFCTLPDHAMEKIHLLMRQADQEMIRFKMVPDVKDYFRKNVKVQWFGHMQVLSARTEPLELKLNQVLKRVFDISISLIVIIFLLSWLFPLMALLIKLGSKGPVFFRQLRSGKNNEPFWCIKFRSMVLNAEANSLQAAKNDPRVTIIGAFMRRNSIDELPQFFNVLLGNMSVVGPRPHMLQHTAAYAELIDQYMLRHFVLPGITGWAQVKGLRGETSDHQLMQERVEADIWYLENWSLFLDMKIVFLTAWHMLAGSENAH
jgi:putative colanic acid biosynthesis UDP-glucose lipid carrier transferase